MKFEKSNDLLSNDEKIFWISIAREGGLEVAALRVELAQYKRFAERMQANLAAEAALLEARNSTAAAETRRGEEARA